MSNYQKKTWTVLDNLNSQPVFRWLSREEIEMRTADKPQKLLTFGLKPEARDIIQTESRNIYSVPYNQIARELETILARRERCGLVIPNGKLNPGGLPWQGHQLS